MSIKQCPVCKEKIRSRRYLFCPICGFRLDYKASKGEQELDKIKYLWEREEGGRFLYKNFKSVQNIGVMLYKNTKLIRMNLGDFAHIYLLNLRHFSFLYQVPDFTQELYKIGKLIGYYSAYESIKIKRLWRIFGILTRTAFFCKILENKRIQNISKEGWQRTGAANINLIEIDKKRKIVRYSLEDSFESIFENISKPTCIVETGILCGFLEALSNHFCGGFETKCRSTGNPNCEVEIHLHEKEIEPNLPQLTKDDLDRILDKIVDYIIKKKEVKRKNMSEYKYFACVQPTNYFLVSLSPGHGIISKYSGRICGERIAEKANIHGLDNAIDYSRDLFLYLKVGILEEPQKVLERIFIEMSESVYASGVKNIHNELCIYLAGLISGL